MQDLVLTLAKALVDKPESVAVTESTTARGSVLTLTVAREDIGKVIGKDGRTAQAIRTVLHAACGKTNRRVQLDIAD